jgi:predicted transcriptional regulator YdeE
MEDYQHGAFNVTGYKITTTNKDFQSRNDIGSAWKKWTVENIAASVQGKVSETLHCIYFNHTDADNIDERGYDMLIGFNTFDDAVQTNPELTTITIPAQDYKYDTAVGEMPIALINKWKEINELSKAEVNRSFGYDMDLYLEDGSVMVAVSVTK